MGYDPSVVVGAWLITLTKKDAIWARVTGLLGQYLRGGVVVHPLVTSLSAMPSMARTTAGSRLAVSANRFCGSATAWMWGKAATIMTAMSARVTIPRGLKFPSSSWKAPMDTSQLA